MLLKCRSSRKAEMFMSNMPPCLRATRGWVKECVHNKFMFIPRSDNCILFVNDQKQYIMLSPNEVAAFFEDAFI